MVFAVARTAWTLDDTKYWIGGITLLSLLPLMGYFLMPYRMVSAVIGVVLGLSLTLAWQNRYVERWLKSLSALVVGGVFFGGLTWSIGGSNSTLMAAFFTATLFAFLCTIVLYWRNPGITAALQVLGSSIFVGLIVTAIVWNFDMEVLGILKGLTLQKLFGYVFSFLAFLMGVPWEDLVNFGQLIGNKVVVNEFVAFLEFQKMAADGLISPRSMVIASYALCGFANFSSIAIQIGGIGGIAPNRESELAQLGLRAMMSGALASFQTATVAGIMFAIADKIGIDLVNIGANL